MNEKEYYVSMIEKLIRQEEVETVRNLYMELRKKRKCVS